MNPPCEFCGENVGGWTMDNAVEVNAQGFPFVFAVSRLSEWAIKHPRRRALSLRRPAASRATA